VRLDQVRLSLFSSSHDAESLKPTIQTQGWLGFRSMCPWCLHGVPIESPKAGFRASTCMPFPICQTFVSDRSCQVGTTMRWANLNTQGNKNLSLTFIKLVHGMPASLAALWMLCAIQEFLNAACTERLALFEEGFSPYRRNRLSVPWPPYKTLTLKKSPSLPNALSQRKGSFLYLKSPLTPSLQIKCCARCIASAYKGIYLTAEDERQKES
jgi:hypothetical protein